jgi:hypothetical protein
MILTTKGGSVMKKLILFVVLMVMGCGSPTGPESWWDMNMYAEETYGEGYWTVYWDAPEFDIYEAQNVYIQMGEYGSGITPLEISGVQAMDIIDTGSYFITPDVFPANWYLMHAEFNGWVYEELLDF